MKKSFILFLVIIGLLSALTLGGCNNRESNNDTSNNNSSNNSSSGSNTSNQSLTLNKKYILYSDVSAAEGCQNYFVFKDEKTGECNSYSYYSYISGHGNTIMITSYKIKFIYLIIEDTVICFYDSVTYAPAHNEAQSVQTTWRNTLGFSKDILMNTASTIYICENYLPEIPNFGK